MACNCARLGTSVCDLELSRGLQLLSQSYTSPATVVRRRAALARAWRCCEHHNPYETAARCAAALFVEHDSYSASRVPNDTSLPAVAGATGFEARKRRGRAGIHPLSRRIPAHRQSL